MKKISPLAIRSGDYYMFDELNDDDLADLVPSAENLKKQAQSKEHPDKHQRGMSVSQVCSVESTYF